MKTNLLLLITIILVCTLVCPAFPRDTGQQYCTRILVGEKTELSLYTSTMFRLRVSDLTGEKFPPKYEIPFVIGHLDPWEEVSHETWQEGDYVYIKTDRILIEIDAQSYQWKVYDPEGENQVCPSKGPIYGMFRDGYTVFDNASSFGELNNNSRFSHYFYNPSTGRYVDTYLEEDLISDVYFIYGPDYPSLFNQFNQLVGPEPLLPKKAYGFFQTQHLTCSGSQDKLMQMAHELRARDIPCDNLIIDFEWGDGCDGSQEIDWGSRLDWSPQYANPLSPKQMLDSLDAMHFDVMLIHHSAPNFINRANQGWTQTVWPEEVWWSKFMEKLSQGVDGTWQDTRKNDITDGVIWDRLRSHFGTEKRVLFMGCRKMQALNPWDAYFTALPMNQLIGARRYPFDWTGDCSYSWNELKWQIKAITNTHGSMKGVTYISSDAVAANWKIQARWNQFTDFTAISRSHNPKPWSGDIDVAGFVSKIRITGRDTVQIVEDNPVRKIDDRPTAESSIRKNRQLRYRLLPYLYTYAHLNYQTGLPICRPMLMAYPADHHVNGDQWPYQYMYGDWILVAPVYGDFQSTEIYLPAGHQWIDYWSGEIYQGGGILQYDTRDIEKLPLFIKAGAILPMREDQNWIDPGVVDDPLTLEVYPAPSSSFSLIEDDGLSTLYQKGQIAEIRYECTAGSSGDIQFKIHEVKGNYKGSPEARRYILKFRGIDPPKQILVNNKKIERAATPDTPANKEPSWCYDLNRSTLNIQICVNSKTDTQISIR